MPPTARRGGAARRAAGRNTNTDEPKDTVQTAQAQTNDEDDTPQATAEEIAKFAGTLAAADATELANKVLSANAATAGTSYSMPREAHQPKAEVLALIAKVRAAGYRVEPESINKFDWHARQDDAERLGVSEDEGESSRGVKRAAAAALAGDDDFVNDTNTEDAARREKRKQQNAQIDPDLLGAENVPPRRAPSKEQMAAAVAVIQNGGDFASAREAASKVPRFLERTYPEGGRRRGWTEDETNALVDALKTFGPQWAKIERAYGRNGTESEILADRSQGQLKDKARNLKMWYLKNNQEVPSFFEKVTGKLPE